MNVGHRVLIVDDHPSFRATARVLLEAEGFDVVGEAADGASALTEAGRLQPEVVLLDVQLPDIDGFDVAARLTGNDDGPVVILVSSRDSSDFGPLVTRSGARGFVPKAELSGDRLHALSMTGLRRALLSVAFAGVVAAAAASALVLGSDHVPMPGAAIAVGLVITASFIGTGLYAWWRRPSNRFGALMTAVGFTFLLGVADRLGQQRRLHGRRDPLQPLLRRLRPHGARLPRGPARAPLARLADRHRLRADAAREPAAAAVGLQRRG